MQAADRRAADLEKKQKDQDDKDLSEAEKAKKDAADAEARANAAEVKLREEKIFNAFLSSKDVTWHDVTDAFTMLKNNYMDGVDVDSNGKVTGIDPAVKKLAKEKAYLVKVATDNSDSTGAAHNGQRKGDQKDTSKEQRMSRFPAAYGPR
jgi:tRNA G26 N,N-dimethylase Trm1